MIANPGFSFSNVTGKHFIDTYNRMRLPDLGPLYSKIIICKNLKSIELVYSHHRSSSLNGSLALKFLSINIDNDQEILDFCDRYGLINSTRNALNISNEYIFHGMGKSDFAKKIPLHTPEYVYLTDIKKAIISMRLLHQLNSAIQEKAYDDIVKIITFFCFDLTVRNYQEFNPSTELSMFNYEFCQYAINNCGYEPFNYDKFDYKDAFTSFYDEIIADLNLTMNHAKKDIPCSRTFYLHDYSEWHHICSLFHDVFNVTELQSITPFGEVVFCPDLSEVAYLKTLNKQNLLNLAKAVLIDLFKQNLGRITPEIRYGIGRPTAAWYIPTLLNAMYLELFFQISPNSQMKICADPTCGKPFQWTSATPNKKYCSNSCAQRMAQRNRRKRQKEVQKQKNSPKKPSKT